ncbi:kelch domain-containing protein [Mycena capillaripes]|nr:kelch domain-containing protein [Mycena capillaripes]
MKFVPHLALALSALPLLLASPSPREVHLRTGTWTDVAPTLHGPRQEQSVVALDSAMYIIGGISSPPPDEPFSFPTINWTQVYTPQTNMWRDVAPLPHTVNHGNAAAVDGKLYLLGGLDGTTDWVAIPQSYVYSPAANKWTPLPDMPAGTARGAAAVGVHGHTVYLAGGLLELNLITGAQPSSAAVSAFNTLTRQWSVLPSLPEARDHVGGAVIGDTFFVVGGRVNGVPNVRDTVFTLDLNAVGLGWVEKARMPTARGGLSTAVIGDRIYTFGGEGDVNVVPNGVYDNVEVYCAGEDRWEVLPPMPHPRHGTNAASIAGRIYIPGGGNVTGAGLQSLTDFFSP